MKTIHDLLAEHPFFDALEASDLELIAGCSRNVHLAQGRRIASYGQPADLFYVLRAGRVALEISAPGREPLVIETLGAGEVLGVSWLFPPYRWAFDVTALDEVSAVEVDGACLRGKCDADPRLGYLMVSRFALLMRDRLQATRVRLLDIYGRSNAR